MTDVDVDQATALAWSRFHQLLVDGFERHDGADGGRIWATFRVPGAVADSGPTPAVRVFRPSQAQGIYVWIADTDHLDPAYRVGEDARRFLVDNGWEQLGSTFAVRDEPDTRALAAQVMHALRQVFGVVHPAFLELGNGALALMGPGWAALVGPVEADLAAAGDDEEPEGEEERCTCADGDHDLQPWAEGEEPLAVVVESSDELLDAARRSLVPLLGHLPCVDEDGDIVVAGDRALLWVAVSDQEPRLDAFSTILTGVRRRAQAAIEVGLLNRDHPLLKFRLVGDRVVVRAELTAVPFCPAQLRLVVDRLHDALSDVAGDLAARCGGEPWALHGIH
jgi:hypothetical protein